MLFPVETAGGIATIAPMHPLHDLTPGNNPPFEINVLVEIPKGSRNKYELDKKTGMFKLDRTLYSPMIYPGDYGLVPQTHYDDGDPLDVLILGNEPTFTGCIVEVRPIGIFRMLDKGDHDDKILAVPVGNPYFKSFHDLIDVPPPAPVFLAALLLCIDDHVPQVRQAASRLLERVGPQIDPAIIMATAPFFVLERRRAAGADPAGVRGDGADPREEPAQRVRALLGLGARAGRAGAGGRVPGDAGELPARAGLRRDAGGAAGDVRRAVDRRARRRAPRAADVGQRVRRGAHAGVRRARAAASGGAV